MSACTHLVVGLDGSDTSQHALRWAAQQVESAEKLIVVHGGESEPVVPGDVAVGTIHVRDEAPAIALMQVAAEIGADAIVIGAHGSGLGVGLGKVAKRLLRKAQLPVVVIEERDPPRTVTRPAPVVACVGYGIAADAAATWAADYATEKSLPLVLLHAVAYRPVPSLDSPSDVLASYLGSGVSVEWANEDLNKAAASLRERYPHLAITTHVDTSSVIEAVRAAGEIAELVVVGKRSEDEFLHSLATPRLRRLVARAHFPIAVVPSG